jgi:hypothetical protein
MAKRDGSIMSFFSKKPKADQKVSWYWNIKNVNNIMKKISL